jgi:hypothetical protein
MTRLDYSVTYEEIPTTAQRIWTVRGTERHLVSVSAAVSTTTAVLLILLGAASAALTSVPPSVQMGQARDSALLSSHLS